MTEETLNEEYRSLIIAHPINQTPKYITLKGEKRGEKKIN